MVKLIVMAMALSFLTGCSTYIKTIEAEIQTEIRKGSPQSASNSIAGMAGAQATTFNGLAGAVFFDVLFNDNYTCVQKFTETGTNKEYVSLRGFSGQQAAKGCLDLNKQMCLAHVNLFEGKEIIGSFDCGPEGMARMKASAERIAKEREAKKAKQSEKTED